jgi:hypothetical protein
MKPCDRQASGAIELYFYGELAGLERESLERHLPSCAECSAALEELEVIRAALSSRPVVSAPPNDDWRGFMTRLDQAVELERQTRDVAQTMGSVRAAPRSQTYAPYLALAALLTIVTMSVAYFGRPGRARMSDTPVADTTSAPSEPTAAPDPAFAQLSEQHFERSKLVVLGLANKDPRLSTGADWQYERQLASTLLSDTRLYRQTAEQRGMRRLARVMNDLELVLLQTSMAEEPDPETLEHIQRLIRTRDLVTKMTAVGQSGI